MRAVVGFKPRQLQALGRKRRRKAHQCMAALAGGSLALRWPLLRLAEDGNDVLSVAKQSNDIQVICGLKVEPLHRKARDAPGAQACDLAQLSKARRAQAGHALDWLEGFERRVEHLFAQDRPTLLCVVPRAIDEVLLGPWAQPGGLQRGRPSARRLSSADTLGVSARAGPD